MVLTQIDYYGTSFQDVRLAKGAGGGEHHQIETKKKWRTQNLPQPTTLKRKVIVLGLYTNIKKYSWVPEDSFLYGWLSGFQFKTK